MGPRQNKTSAHNCEGRTWPSFEKASKLTRTYIYSFQTSKFLRNNFCCPKDRVVGLSTGAESGSTRQFLDWEQPAFLNSRFCSPVGSDGKDRVPSRTVKQKEFLKPNAFTSGDAFAPVLARHRHGRSSVANGRKENIRRPASTFISRESARLVRFVVLLQSRKNTAELGLSSGGPPTPTKFCCACMCAVKKSLTYTPQALGPTPTKVPVHCNLFSSPFFPFTQRFCIDSPLHENLFLNRGSANKFGACPTGTETHFTCQNSGRLGPTWDEPDPSRVWFWRRVIPLMAALHLQRKDTEIQRFETGVILVNHWINRAQIFHSEQTVHGSSLFA